MKSLIAIALIAAATPALAQTAPAPAPAPAPAATPKFTLDTPIGDLVADPAAKAVLDKDLGNDITKLDAYDQIKGMSLNQVKPYAPDKLPDALMTKIAADLAAIK